MTKQAEAQNKYLIAKSFEKKTFEILCEMVKDLDWDADFDKAFDQNEEARMKSGYAQAYHNLIEAENQLLSWMKKEISNKMKNHLQLNEALKPFDKAYLIPVRKMLIELSMKYDPTV